MSSELREQLDSGVMSTQEAATQLALMTVMQKIMKDSEKILRDYLTENIGPKESRETGVGSVSYKRGAESKWGVKDPVAFADWLKANGEESSVETVAYPLEFITKPDAIEKLVRDHGGEQPAGVEYSGGRNDTVAVSLPKNWRTTFMDEHNTVGALKALGIEQAPMEPKEVVY
jgi:hypothetical protein